MFSFPVLFAFLQDNGTLTADSLNVVGWDWVEVSVFIHPILLSYLKYI